MQLCPVGLLATCQAGLLLQAREAPLLVCLSRVGPPTLRGLLRAHEALACVRCSAAAARLRSRASLARSRATPYLALQRALLREAQLPQALPLAQKLLLTKKSEKERGNQELEIRSN